MPKRQQGTMPAEQAPAPPAGSAEVGPAPAAPPVTPQWPPYPQEPLLPPQRVCGRAQAAVVPAKGKGGRGKGGADGGAWRVAAVAGGRVAWDGSWAVFRRNILPARSLEPQERPMPPPQWVRGGVGPDQAYLSREPPKISPCLGVPHPDSACACAARAPSGGAVRRPCAPPAGGGACLPRMVSCWGIPRPAASTPSRAVGVLPSTALRGWPSQTTSDDDCECRDVPYSTPADLTHQCWLPARRHRAVACRIAVSTAGAADSVGAGTGPRVRDGRPVRPCSRRIQRVSDGRNGRAPHAARRAG